jgi:hypothetical protein
VKEKGGKRRQDGKMSTWQMKIIFWRRLRSSPAKSNDSHKLELPGAWKPSNSSRPLPDGEGKETQHIVSHRNNK